MKMFLVNLNKLFLAVCFLFAGSAFAETYKVSLVRTLTGIQIKTVTPAENLKATNGVSNSTSDSAQGVDANSVLSSQGEMQLSAFDNKNAFSMLCPQGLCSAKLLRSIPYFLREHDHPSQEIYEEYLVTETPNNLGSLAIAWRSFLQSKPPTEDLAGLKNAEVRVIREQGPKENRINLTILGDGYTQAEREKFFEDCARVSAELFDGKTFASYKPLFNVYAVFVPSAVSGIGDGRPANTAFGLYRDPAGSKRAIMPGNEQALEAALALAPATDYPIVIANDEYYGGLGGRYAISTNSVESGMIVLRHELGHNFGEVGEEYDNGMVYSGANASRSKNVPWTHWLDGDLKINEARQMTGDYVWQNLGSGSYKKQFQVNLGANGYVYARISSVGWETPNDVLALVDGKPIELVGKFTKDRSFFNIAPSGEWSVGTHTIEFKDNNRDGDNVLAFATLFELPKDYDFTDHKIGAYATFNEWGGKSYRPTHDSCLMREMTIDYFCSVDQENMWHKFLNRVSLVDDVEVVARTAKLTTPPVDGLTQVWQVKSAQGVWTTIPEHTGRSEVTNLAPGNYRVQVSFKTPEVRKYNSLFTDVKEFVVR